MKMGINAVFALLVLFVFIVPGIAGQLGNEDDKEQASDGQGERYDYIPSAHEISVPYYPQESAASTGQAALECVFDFYGAHVSQAEIDDVIGPLFGASEAEEDEMVRGGHFSNRSNANNNPSLNGYSDRGLGYAAFAYNWGNRPGNPSPYYNERKNDLMRMVSNNTPVIVWTNVNGSVYTGNVWRVVTGYDEFLGWFMLHDLTANGPTEYGGEGVKIGMGNFLTNIWNTSGGDSIAVVVQPWVVEIDMPVEVLAGQTFDVSVSATYSLQVHMRGTDFRASNVEFALDMPPDFTLENDTYVKDSEIRNGGESETMTWKVIAPDKGNNRMDMVYVNVTGFVKGRVGIRSYDDVIGGGAKWNISVSGMVNHVPTISNATADPASIPNDGKTETLITAHVIDPDDNLQDVEIDLSKMGRSRNQKMFDDGTHGDPFPNDDIFSIMETAPSAAVAGFKTMEITATDTLGRYSFAEVELEVTEPAGPPPDPGKPPVMSDFYADPASASNDGTDIVLLTVRVTDPDGDLSSVTIDLRSIGGGADEQMKDDGTSGDPGADDDYYTYQTTIDSSVAEGKKSITAHARDKKGNNASISTNFTVSKTNLKPELASPSAEPKEVPNDSTTLVLLTVSANDPNNNLKTVVVALTPIGGVSNQKMFDDGTNGDQKKNDKIYSFQTNVPSTVGTGQKDLKVTATDTEGLTATEHIFLQVIDTNAPPVLEGPSMDLKVANDNKTYIIITITVTDPDGNLDGVRIDLSPLGGESQAKMYDDGENGGDTDARDNIYSVRAKVSLNTPPGQKNLTVTATDAKGASVNTRVSVEVEQRGEDDDGNGDDNVFIIVLVVVIILGAILIIAGVVVFTGKGSKTKENRKGSQGTKVSMDTFSESR